MKKIGIVANVAKASAPDVLARFAETAARLGLRLVAEPAAAKFMPGARRVAPEKIAGEASLLMVFGGDGTMLRAIRLLGGKPVPVLGVNLGSLGFLANVAQQDAEPAIKSVISGRYTVYCRSLAECAVLRAGRTISRYRALNDIVIDRGASSRITTLDMWIEGEEVSSFMCDGIIVSTPTGSTGHSLSAGGPILHPEAGDFVISLICPHTLSTRPLVVPDRKKIVIRVSGSADDMSLSVDGQVGRKLRSGDRVQIRRSRASARFVRLSGYSYFSVLRQKLHWRGSNLA